MDSNHLLLGNHGNDESLGPPTEVEQVGGEMDVAVNEDYHGVNECTIENQNQKVEEPKVDMMFDSHQDVLSYYMKYAKQEGFGVTKRTSTTVDDGELRYFSIACSRHAKLKSRSCKIDEPKAVGGLGCKAKINAKQTLDGWYTLSNVVLEHNHILSLGKARHFPCHKKLDARVKRRLELMDKAGIHSSKNYKALVVEVGGYENIPFGEKDCRNHINKVKNQLLGEGDAEAFRNYLLRMQEKNDNFFYVMDLDDDSRLKNVFWADARSRAAYQSFGDVITFDTTYLMNKYKMSFAPSLVSIIMVNHYF